MKSEVSNFFKSLPHCPKTWKGSMKGKKLTRDHKIYEIYIYTLVADQFLKHSDWNLKINSIKGRNRVFIFRGSPGFLWSKENFGFIELENKNNGRIFELHQGVQIAGESGNYHEIDFGIYERNYALKARLNRRNNKTGSSIPLTIECKYYDKSEVNKNLGRYYIGLALDTGRALRLGHSSSTNVGMLVTSGHDKNKNIDMLFDYYRIPYLDNLEPSNPLNVNLFKVFINHFMRSL